MGTHGQHFPMDRDTKIREKRLIVSLSLEMCQLWSDLHLAVCLFKETNISIIKLLFVAIYSSLDDEQNALR